MWGSYFAAKEFLDDESAILPQRLSNRPEIQTGHGSRKGERQCGWNGAAAILQHPAVFEEFHAFGLSSAQMSNFTGHSNDRLAKVLFRVCPHFSCEHDV